MVRNGVGLGYRGLEYSTAALSLVPSGESERVCYEQYSITGSPRASVD